MGKPACRKLSSIQKMVSVHFTQQGTTQVTVTSILMETTLQYLIFVSCYVKLLAETYAFPLSFCCVVHQIPYIVLQDTYMLQIPHTCCRIPFMSRTLSENLIISVLTHLMVQCTTCAEQVVQIQNSTMLLNNRVETSPLKNLIDLGTTVVAEYGNVEYYFTFCKEKSF